jgi:hypothetical protein
MFSLADSKEEEEDCSTVEAASLVAASKSAFSVA